MVHRDAVQRDERQHVEGADPRMAAAMVAKVDRGQHVGGERERGRPHDVRPAEKREDRSVVIGIRVDVREAGAGVADGRGEPLHDGRIAPLAHVGNALDHDGLATHGGILLGAS